MKSLFILFITVFASISTYAINKDAVSYNDKIVGEQTKIGEAIIAFSSNPNDFSLTQIKTQADNSIGVLNTMKPLDGNKDFLDAAKALFKFYGDITKAEYKKILELLQAKDKYTQEQLTDKINAYTKTIAKKEDPLDVKFHAAQAAFAKKYGFTLTKNELEEKIKGATDN